MSWTDIRERIAAIVASVDGVGVVHQYQRLSTNWDKFLDAFKSTDADGTVRIAGCSITREGFEKRQATLGEKEKAHVVAIRFVRGLRDETASEIDFQLMIEAVSDALESDETLGDTCLSINPDWGPMEGAVGLQVPTIEPRMFGGVLCHFAECRLCAIERVEA